MGINSSILEGYNDNNSDDKNDNNFINNGIETNDPQKCMICWKYFPVTKTVRPDCCTHTFCIRCLKKWSRRTNTCPVDRKMFLAIMENHPYNYKIKCFVQDFCYGTHCVLCRMKDDSKDPIYCECGNFLHAECRGRRLIDLSVLEDEIWFCPMCDPLETALDRDRNQRYLRSSDIHPDPASTEDGQGTSTTSHTQNDPTDTMGQGPAFRTRSRSPIRSGGITTNNHATNQHTGRQTDNIVHETSDEV